MSSFVRRSCSVFAVAATLGALAACGDSTSPSSGSLAVTISAVSGATGSVTVTGPSGYSKVLTTTTTLTGLPLGSYTVTGAPSVSTGAVVGSDTNTATVVGSPATVAKNQTTSVTVTYGISAMTGALWVANDVPGYSMSLVEFGASQLTASGTPTPATSVALSDGYLIWVAFDKQGNLWELNGYNQMLEFSPAEQSSATPTATATLTISGANGVSSFAFDSAGNVWMADPGPCDFYEYKSATLAALAGPVTATPDVSIINNCTGVSHNPLAIAFDQHWNLWVSDNGFAQGSQEVYEYPADSLVPTFSGQNAARVIGGIQQVAGLAFDASGDLWVSGEDSALFEYSAAQLAGTSVTPTPVVFLSLGSNAYTYGFAFDNSGNLWATNYNANTVYELSTTQLATSGTVSAPAVVLGVTGTSLQTPVALAFQPAASGLPLFAKVPKAPRISAAKHGVKTIP